MTQHVPMVAASPQVIQQIGELTRMLHDTIEQLGVVNVGVMPELQAATSALPDARSRLNYIANKTSDAANRVLNSVDDAKVEHQQLMSESRRIIEAIDAGGRVMVHRHIGNLNASCERIDEHLTNIMMAQDFHDLTGQIIKKVVRVTNELEANLVKLLIDLHPEHVEQAVAEVAAAAPCPAAQAAPAVPAAPAKPSELEGPVVDGTRTDVVTDQNEVDDLLARMGF